ncbi:MAG TPA: SOS response-associated peptidase family protein [Rhizomicrobium sp.]|nr:SOS response-associated peptidase family protein [Rhizomicrobium sp.]
MCGKFTQRRDFANLTRLNEAFGASDAPDETITPMRLARVIALDGKGMRRAVPMRWGLMPSFDTKPHIHARAETIDTKPTFRECFAKRRGLVLVTTFNEGEELSPSRTRQYVLTPKEPVAIAVIWDRTGSGESLLLSFAMVTVAANPLIATITDRMPALIEDGDWAKWLGEEPATVDELKAILKPSEREMEMRVAEPPRKSQSKSGPRPEQAELF